MKKSTLFQWSFLIGIISLWGCSPSEESTFFNGNIEIISSFDETKEVAATRILLEDINDDRMIVCDSFLLFKSYKYQDYWFYVFDKDKRNLISRICPKGEGPDDFLSCIDTGQFITNSNNDKLLWIGEPYKSFYKLVNITQSIYSKKTICDSVVTINWMEKFQYPPVAIFFLADNKIIARNQCEQKFVNDKEYTPGKYRFYQKTLDNIIREDIIYKKPIMPKGNNSTTSYVSYYTSLDRIKPDETKIAMVMQSIGQLNILDITSGKIIGIRQENSLSFKDLEDNVKERRYYYTSIAVDHEFIYAAYSGAIYKGGYPDLAKEIHIFNWEGKAICKLVVDQPILGLSYNTWEQKLYGCNIANEVYSYDVSFLHK
ncbi:BF3164 family lipoprotein [Phocaeicola sp.]